MQTLCNITSSGILDRFYDENVPARLVKKEVKDWLNTLHVTHKDNRFGSNWIKGMAEMILGEALITDPKKRGRARDIQDKMEKNDKG